MVVNKGFNKVVEFFGGLVPFDLTTSRYEDFTQMKSDWDSRGRLRINILNSKNTIFGSETTNWFFRAWHDYCHTITNSPFSGEGEIIAMEEQIKQLNNHPGLTNYEKYRYADLVRFEVKTQYDYYQKHGKFPDNQYYLYMEEHP